MNLELSRAIATLIRALQSCCYRNAMLALLIVPQLAVWRYVEGWIIANEWPIEHGWLVGPTGEIIDPTLALFGGKYAHTRYFAGASFSREEVAYLYHADQLQGATHIPPISYRSQHTYSMHEAARLLAYASRKIPSTM